MKQHWCRTTLTLLLCGLSHHSLAEAAPSAPQRWHCTPKGGSWSCQPHATPPTSTTTQPISHPTLAKPPHTQTEPTQQYANFGDNFDDWQVLPKGQLLCDGRYRRPVFSVEEKDSSTRITADHPEIHLEGRSTLRGNVAVSQSNRRLKADLAYLYRDATSKRITRADALGHVRLEEPNVRINASSAHFQLQRKEATLRDAHYRLYSRHARGQAKRLHTNKNHDVFLHEATFTTCPPGDNLWLVKAGRLDLLKNQNQGRAHEVWLYIKDKPVFYSPWFAFPLGRQRQSGLLAPTFRSSSRSGFEFIQPYYFNIAPNYDDTLTFDYRRDRGPQLQNEFRYLTARSQGILHVEGLIDDDAFREFRRDRLASHPGIANNDPRISALRSAKANRFAISWRHHVTFNQHWRAGLDYGYVSDDNYLVDLGNSSGQRDNRNLLHQATVNYSGNYGSSQLLLQSYQSLQPYDAASITLPYRLLPQLSFETSLPSFAHGLNYQMSGSLSRYDHADEPFTNDKPTVGTEYYLRPTLTWPFERLYGYITPTLALDYTHYNLSLDDTDRTRGVSSQATRMLPILTLDAGLYFDRDLTVWHHHYQQTLEPRLMYAYIPYDNQNAFPNFGATRHTFSFNQLFEPNRFSGHGRVGDTNQLTTAVVSRLISEKTGEEQAQFGIGAIHYFSRRKVTICDTETAPSCRATEDPQDPDGKNQTSPLVSELQIDIAPRWTGRIEAQWDPDDHFHSEKTVISAHYERDPKHLANVLVYSPRDISQTDLSVVWGISPRMNLLGRWHYDFENGYTLESLGGLEYENCCWALRAGISRVINPSADTKNDLSYDTEYSVQFILKGLTSLGVKDPTRHWISSISGYKDNIGRIDHL